MNKEDEQLLADFKTALMKEAYNSFLDWAGRKPEIMAEYEAFVDEALSQGAYEDADKNFVEWVTEYYWGDVE